MNSAGTYKVNIEVRRVGQAIPGLKIVCGGWKREARQDFGVGVGVGVVRSVLKRKGYALKKSNHICTRLLLSDKLQDFEAVGGLSQLRRRFRRSSVGCA